MLPNKRNALNKDLKNRLLFIRFLPAILLRQM